MARIAVIGLGSIGGIAAACLQLSGRHEVTACTRRPIPRITLEHPDGTAELPIRSLTDPTEATPADWVLLCTKTQDTASAAPWLQRLCGPATRIAVLQNGLGHAERVAPFAKGAAAMPVIVYYNGERLAPDRMRLRHVIADDLAVADDAAGRDFAAAFDRTLLKVLVSADFTTLLWRKLFLNAAANPITALTRQRQAVLRRPDIHALCLAALEEAAAVARAEGAHLAPDEPARAMAMLLTFPPEAGTSMYFDTLAGRALEIDALNGAIVAAAERHGIATPVNRTLVALARAVSDEAQRRTSGAE